MKLKAATAEFIKLQMQYHKQVAQVWENALNEIQQ